MRRWLAILTLTIPGLVFAGFVGFAGPVRAALMIDPALSSLTPTVGAQESLSGSLTVALGDPPPLSANTTFDIESLVAMTASGGLQITLDPSLANPAAGVLNSSGSFLIPNLFLELFDGATTFQLTVPNVMGSFGVLSGCPGTRCLELGFDVDTGGPSGVVSVMLFAVPEPGTAALLGVGLAALCLRRREVTR